MGHCWSGDTKHQNPFTKLDQRTTKDLSKKTGLHPQQLRSVYNEFVKKYPDGSLTNPQFTEVYQKFFPSEDISKADRVFNKFDQDENGTIDFREFMIAMNALAQGTLQQKLSLAFYLYDENGDGILNYSEVLGMVKAISATKDQDNKKDTSKPDKVAKDLFSELDLDKDGEITLDEFTKVACKNNTVANFLLVNQTDQGLSRFLNMG